MKYKRFFILMLWCCFGFHQIYGQQKVGLVLSGGGATGLAHIGVLKALEEAEIPIDFISGTSIGAFVGALYAVGYSPNQIEQIVLSDIFLKINSGETPKEERFLLREKDLDAAILNFNLAKDSIFKKSLPTNFVTPAYFDFLNLRLLGKPGASNNKDFDSLFIPFRCLAADIYKKESIVFKSGDLNAAVRASMTYPFYINPIRIDGNLLFDGGLYNNFPADVLYSEFDVDYIIGSNVSSNDSPPREDDIIGQISAMFIRKTNYALPCVNGLIIEPNNEVGTLDFSKAEIAIQSGYIEAKKHIDSILLHIEKKVDKTELSEKRKAFRQKVTPIKISEIAVDSYNDIDISFAKDNFRKDSVKKTMDFSEFKNRYFRTYAAPQIKHLYPTLDKNSDSTYRLKLDVTKQKPFTISVGGHFSSRSINTGYFGLSYYNMGKGAIALYAENYFGKFYGSTKVKADYDLPTLFPIRVSPYFVLNRWDYYNSTSTFFEDIKPSFLLQNEMYYGLSLAIPTSSNGKFFLDFRQFETKNQYYQTQEFLETDTADVTNFSGEAVTIGWEHNTLNRKQWASEGGMAKIEARYVQGKEKSTSGNTQTEEYDLRRFHNWINISIEGQRYFKMNNFFKIGFHAKGVYNSKALFSNYTASLLNLSDFLPLPDANTLFLEEYRAPQFVGGGINFVFNYKSFIELRIDPYFFQPIKRLIRNGTENQATYSGLFTEGTPMAGASVIFHTPIGPLRISGNWFPNQNQPFITQLSFGYVIFNNRAFR